MSSIISLSIELDKIKDEKIFIAENGKKYLNVTLFVNDDQNKFGKAVSLAYQQSLAERVAKEKKEYLGSGNVVWTDGKIKVAAKKPAKPSDNQGADQDGTTDDLPW